MSDKTAIEWTDATWNPTTGCTQVSPGCDHCYALTLSERFRGTPGHYFENGFDVQLRPDKLDQPLRWKKPRRIFVNSMSDLFHDDIPDDYIVKVFDVMQNAPRHTFQVLTKRHARMRSFVTRYLSGGFAKVPLDEAPLVRTVDNPPSHIWLGVSVEDQKWANIRIPALLDTPAAVRFLSCEPLLGPVDLLGKPDQGCDEMGPAITHSPYSWQTSDGPTEYDCEHNAGIDWVVVGGESGRGARPMHPDWSRSLRDQCVEMQIPFLFKQWGAHGPDGVRRDKHANGRELDGCTWDEFPEVRGD